ncbi:MAG: iron chelate uptake ABC transporter family permease subunit, partial [Culicoidibacterales bacterium]
MGHNQKQHQRRFYIIAAIAVVATILFLTFGVQGNIAYALTKRTQRLMAIILSGSSIAIATVLFQTVAQNRILTPNVLGL